MSKPLLADGFDDAFIGYTLIHQTGKMVAVYDSELCIEILMDREKIIDDFEEKTLEDAQEYFEFNVLGAYVGEGTPLFLTKCSIEDFNEMEHD